MLRRPIRHHVSRTALRVQRPGTPNSLAITGILVDADQLLIGLGQPFTLHGFPKMTVGGVASVSAFIANQSIGTPFPFTLVVGFDDDLTPGENLVIHGNDPSVRSFRGGFLPAFNAPVT